MYFLKLNDDSFRFNVELKSDDSIYIFYVISNGVKILTKYVKHPFIIIPSKIFESKKVNIQCYCICNGSKTKEEINNFLYKNIKYTRGYIDHNYDNILKNGYKSFDGKISINLEEIDWSYKNDHNFNFNIHSLRFLASYWGKYLTTYNYMYIEEALNIFKNYWKEIDEKKLNKFKKYDMALGIRSLHIYFLSNFLEFFTSDDLFFYKEIYNFHYNELKVKNSISLNNHGIWQIYGLRMLTFSQGDKNISDVKYCIDELQKLLNYSFNEENVHVENSPFYHNYVGDLFYILPKALFSDSNKLSSVLSSKDQITAWLCDINSNFYQIGDSHGKSSKRKLESYKLKKDLVVDGVNFYSKSFIKSGYFVARTLDKENFNSFVLNCTSDTLIHKHVDNLSFILWHNNVELITDSGPFAYEYNSKREYCLSDKAHNILSLKDVVFSLDDIDINDSKINTIDVLTDSYKIVGTSTYNIFSYKRTIKYFPLNRVLINDLILKNKNNVDITFNLTFGLGVEVLLVHDFIVLQYKGRVIGKIKSISAMKDVKIFNGNLKPMRGWIAKKYNVIEPTYALEIVYDSSISNVEIEIELL